MSCLVITPEIRELASHFPNETLSSVRNMVGIWQEREMEKPNSKVTLDSVPSEAELRSLYNELRESGSVKTVLSKEDMDDLLIDGKLPSDLVRLGERLGIHISINKKTRTLELDSSGATNEDFRVFRALAVDLLYLNGAATRAFGMATPRERLAAIIDYEVKNRRNRTGNADIMNYELQLAKRNLREIFDISTDGEMEALRKQAAESFTSRERMERINEITDWFDRILTDRHQSKLDELAARRDELNEFLKNKDQQDFPEWEWAEEAYMQELGEIQQQISSYSRMKALKEYGPNAIFDDIKQKYADLLSIQDDAEFIKRLGETFRIPASFAKKNLSWYRNQVRAVVDNFLVLADEACKELETTELVRLTLVSNDISDISKERLNQDENTEGEEEGDVDGIENQYKENWMFEYDTTSNWSKMSARVRRMLSRCPLGKRSTRFGSQYRMPVMQVVNTLINEMQGVQDSREMDLVLQSMEKENPWVKYIREEISKDSQLKTELFRTTRRYAQSLGIIQRSSKRGESEDLTKGELMVINSANTVNSIYAAVQNQIASGVPLNKKLSIFKDDMLDLSAVKRIQGILDSYSDDDWDRILSADPSDVKELLVDFPNLFPDICGILRAIGFTVTPEDVRVISARDVRQRMVNYKNNLGGLLSIISSLVNQIDDNGYQTTDDLINERKDRQNKSVMKYYNDISKILTLTDNAAIEPSIRENGKVRYSFVLPSVLDDLITGLQGKRFSHIGKNGQRVNMTPAEFIIDRFGDDPRFAYKEENEDGTVTYHFRNHILEEIANGDTFYKPSYITILNTDTAGRDKLEQRDLTQTDRLNMMWAMYHMNDNARYENAQGHWFPIPLPSDSGRMAFISFLPISDIDRSRDIIKEAIIKELERMTEGDLDAHLPETYRKNQGRFCTFPVLNDVDIAGYSVDEIVGAYVKARNTDQYSDLDSILSDLVAVVEGSMIEKFAEENRDFYEARAKEVGYDVVGDMIIEESIFQMSVNELLNGDPAYYTGYNTGSDNIQKRAKQSIVPLDHIDIYNEDFQEAYKAYHGLDPDAELEPDEITEHCLYITDPDIPSPSYDDLEKLYTDAVNDEIIDPETARMFLEGAKSITYTDGQAFRSFESMRMMMYALGEMKKGDELDLALGRIAEGKQQPGDAFIVRTALKPFLSGLIPIQEGDGSTRLMPVQHKLSEQILTAALVQASGTKLGTSPALRALSRFMKDQHADVAIFTSGVKAGNNGSVDFGDLDINSATEDEIYQRMVEEMERYRRETGMPLIHEIPYSLYGIVAQNPDSGMDGSDIPIGVQLQKLISADLPDEIRVVYNDSEGKKVRYEKATYPVDGVGELTKDEIIALYNKLMTEKILRAYREVTGTFADKNQLSRALMRSCRNSSRNSGYLERAFSLDEYGNFVIPLCDLATLNMSSEFLNSIVKNAVSRISAPGKQLVSMSAFGYAKDLKIEFEYDDDGYPIRYKSIDCLLPAWSRHIVARCVDENGMIDFKKLERESPELCYAVGVRIPTQFKNFILPLRCVGFLPTILGDTIVTAIDSVVLQDADFDNDKVPTIFPSFTANYYVDGWKDKIFDDYKKYCDEYYDYELMHSQFKLYMEKNKGKKGFDEKYTFRDFYHEKILDAGRLEEYRKPDSPKGTPMTLWQYENVHKSEYLRPEGPSLKYIRFDYSKKLEDQSEDAINNGIINVMRGMLTGKAVSTMSLASGSPKLLDPIIKKLNQYSPKKTYPDSPSDISTRISQETRNNDGKQMIAVFANAEAMQAMLQHTGVGLIPGAGVKINGRALESLHDITIENSLQYISRYIGTALGGAADNAKVPRLSAMNINLRTAPVVSLMMMLGYTLEEVSFFLNIPSIRHYTDTGNFDGYAEPDMNYLPQELPGDLQDMLDAKRFGDNYDDMDEDLANYCDTALGVFMYLKGLGERMRGLASLARGDSGGTAPHGPLENNLVRFLNYELFREREHEDPMFENWEDIIDYDYLNEVSPDAVDSAANPIAQAYISYGVVGAFQKLSEYYPGIGDANFREQVKNIIKKYYGGVATVTNVKNIMYSLYNYIESSYDCLCKEGLSIQESRNYYLNYFPEEAAQILAEHPEIEDSLLFRRLRLLSTLETDEDPFISLMYDGVMLPQVRDEFTAVWQQMFYSKDADIRELALDLFKYCYFRNGFRFSSGTFAHLAPAEARLFFPGYIEMLESMQDGLDAKTYKGFEHQFVRNNLYDKRFCRTVPVSTIKPDYRDPDGTPRDHITIKYRSKMDEAHRSAFSWYFGQDADNDKPRTAFVITQKTPEGIRYLYYMKVSDNDVLGESTYALTTPLGWKDKAVEYSATEPGVTMPSVFDQSEVAAAVRPKKYRKRKKSSVKTQASAGNRANSSEEPNAEVEESGDFWGSGPKSVRKSSKKKEAKGSKTKAKSKGQVAREKSGGKKSSSKFKVIKDTSSTGRISDVEARCAKEIGAYTVCVTDDNSSQLGMMIHTATQRDSHWVDAAFEKGNEYEIARDLSKKLARKTVKSVVLNLTGSYMNTIGKYATQEDLDAYALRIFKAIKDKGIYVSKVVSTAQPGIPLASARAAMKLGYVLEVHPTSDYKVYGKMGEKPTADKDAFFANLDSSKVSDEGKKGSLVYDREDGPFITAKNKWTREIAAKDKKTLYVFTDNTDRTSGTNRVSPASRYSGQYGRMRILSYPNTTSAVIRGLKNAFPLSTQKKFSQGKPSDGQWTDADLKEFKTVISAEIKDIIKAFESRVYKRVVLPVGGVFEGPISDISQERTPKLYKELMKQMEYLKDSIEKIAETEVNDDTDDEEGEYDVKVDKNDVLSADDIQETSFAGTDIQPSNVYLINIKALATSGIRILNSSGEAVSLDRMFVALPTGERTAYPTAESWAKARVYTGDGIKIDENLFFTLPTGRTKYSLLEASKSGIPMAVTSNLASALILTSKKPYNKSGLTWLDDNNEPICK